MKSQFVNGLAEGARVDATFVLRAKELRSTRTGDAYLTLELADRTGSIPAVWFKPEASSATVPAGTVVRVSGRVTSYRGTRRVSITSLVAAREFDLEDMVPAGRVDRDQAIGEFRRMASTIADPELRRLIKAVFGDELFLERFTACPGSRSMHHAYLGGLLEHSLTVARTCDALAALYDQVERDLLVTAALMHDMGKVDELDWGTGIEFTDEGRLIGHVVLGEHRLRAAASRLRTPVSQGLLARLSHAMLSHHGELEWGAPKKPSTIEALLLHHADNLDAKATAFTELVTASSSLDERWTDAQNMFRRPLYSPLCADAERASRVDEEALYATAPA